MKANMFTRPEIAAALQNFVLVELYTDGTDAVSEENQKLQLEKFKTIAIPFYAILDGNEKEVATFAAWTRDPGEFLAFLNRGSAGAPAPAAPAAKAAESTVSLPGVKLLDGSPLDTAALSGKVVVVNFWATWCVPCIQEIPGFNKLHRELGPKGVVIVGISMDQEGLARVNPFLKKRPMDYLVALGSEEVGKQYSAVESLPVTVILDRNGNQVKRFVGFTAESVLEEAVRGAL
jgi:thiol-disulfide isomerase/thioredoxin